MECELARFILRSVAGRLEVDEKDREALEEHLRQCPACGQRVRSEQQFDERLRQIMMDVAVPEAPRSRLLALLAQKHMQRTRRRMLAAALGVAACLLAIIVFVGVHREPGLKEIDFQGAYVATEQQRGATPEVVQNWFRATYGIVPATPSRFNYEYLAFFDLANFQGDRVPVLLFTRGRAQARVYVLSARSFDLEHVQPIPGYSVEFLREGEASAGFLVVFTSETLDPFLSKQLSSQTHLEPNNYEVARSE